MLEYSKNRKTTSILWSYYRDKASSDLSSNNESIKYKTSITGNTYDGDDNTNKVGKNETEAVVPLKPLSSFWRILNIPLINFEIELILIWSKKRALADMAVRAAGNNNDPPAIVAPIAFKFQITGTKLYVPVATLSTENDKKLLEQLKSGYKSGTNTGNK